MRDRFRAPIFDQFWGSAPQLFSTHFARELPLHFFVVFPVLFAAFFSILFSTFFPRGTGHFPHQHFLRFFGHNSPPPPTQIMRHDTTTTKKSERQNKELVISGERPSVRPSVRFSVEENSRRCCPFAVEEEVDVLKSEPQIRRR